MITHLKTLGCRGDVVHPAKTGQFVILKDNQEASGFSFADTSWVFVRPKHY